MMPPTEVSDPPLVTIGMPVRNGEPYFERALAAVLVQDYPNLEIIVSDNGSTDGTSVLLARIAGTDRRLNVCRQHEVLTAFDNFAWVMRRASGRYFMWAAHDDLRSPDYVSSLVSCLERYPKAVLAFGDLRVSPVFGESYFRKQFNYETPGKSRLSRMRQAAYQQCFHIYGVWRLDALRRIPFVFNPWWPDLPLMVAAAALGEFRRVEGLNFDYLELRKTNEQRAQYQDNTQSVNRVARTLCLFRVTFSTVKGAAGFVFGLLATWFVIEKQLWVIYGLLTGRVRRGDL